MKRAKVAKKVKDFDYDEFYNKKLLGKTKVLVNWFNKSMSTSNDKPFVLGLLLEKFEEINRKLFIGYIDTIDYSEVVMRPDSFQLFVLKEFERKEKLAHSKFISSTLKSDLVKNKSERESQITRKQKKLIVNQFAYYKAYLSFLEHLNKEFDNQKKDFRIKGKLNQTEIRNYFVAAFSEKQKDLEPILKPIQIEQFLQANFADFEKEKKLKKFDTPNTTQQKIRKIVYNFYLKHNPKTKTDMYVYLLLNNFSKFDNTTFSSEKSNFHK